MYGTSHYVSCTIVIGEVKKKQSESLLKQLLFLILIMAKIRNFIGP